MVRDITRTTITTITTMDGITTATTGKESRYEGHEFLAMQC